MECISCDRVVSFAGGPLDSAAPKRTQVRGGSDAELAKEMNELSVMEREKILEELHGIGGDLNETPEFLADSLAQLDRALAVISPPKRRALDRALFLNPSLQHNSKLKLVFLRADLHDAYKAANRMAKYYEDKRTLFGDEKLAKSITLEDLDEQDLAFFQSDGCALVLTAKDPAGRPIVFFNMKRLDETVGSSAIRCSWYVVMSLLEDEMAQTKGMCVVDYFVDDPFKMVASQSPGAVEVFMRAGDILTNLPIRKTSFHVCCRDTRMKLLLSTLRVAIGKDLRLRLRTHCGSPLEIQYSLLPFGIECRDLLECNEGERVRLQRQYLEKRNEIDESMKARRLAEEAKSGVILYPTPKDVLIGRGRPYRDYVGNLLMGQLVDERMERYHGGDRFEKTCLSTDVVQRVRDIGGRFLQRHAVGWKTIDDKVAREKMASVFRTKALSQNNSKNSRPQAAMSNGDLVMADYGSKPKRFRYDPMVLNVN